MTKARDLAGFASSSVTTTASDGLVLKGDGSSTDVVIKNGANATVATVADGTTTLAATANLTAGGSITATGASVGALVQGAIQVGNSSGVAAPLTIGSSAQLLQSNGTTAAWATVSTGTPDVVFPSDWASPTASYTSSGTYSKGSLSDDDYVWIYILSGGGGGGSRASGGDCNGGSGGSSMLLYGKAGVFNGGTYVVAAGKAGNSAGTATQTVANKSSFTLSSANGSTVFEPHSTNNTTPLHVFTVLKKTLNAVDLASYADFTQTSIEPDPYTWSDLGLPSGMSYRYLSPRKAWNDITSAENCIFGGGNGGAFYQTTKLNGTSEFSGNGGATASQGVAGTFPGGGGGGSQSASNSGGAGAAGNVRVYHV